MKKKIYEGITNSGKTNQIKKDIKDLIKTNRSMIILDTKKEYEELFKNTNYEVIKVDITDINSMIEYNPLKIAEDYYKKNDIDTAIDKIMALANMLFKSDGSIDPFWDNSARSLFIGICIYILETRRNLSLKEVIKISISELDELTEYINKQDVLSTINIITSSVINSPKETKGGIISVLNQQLAAFAHRPTLLNKLSTEKDIELKPTNQVILLTNFDQKLTYNIIIENIIINTINEMINSKKEYAIVLDNFDTLMNYDEFNKLLNTYLSDNIECFIGIRDRDLIK